jgi:hypothetical protein
MRDFRTWSLALAALALWVTPARPAEDPRLVPEEGAVQIMLLRQPAVQSELKLTPEEIKQIDEFTSRQWKKAQALEKASREESDQKFTEMTRENERFLREILEPDQSRRLRQITLQVAGLLWVTRPRVATELNLTDEQKVRARQYQQEARKEAEDLIHAGSSDQWHEKMHELRETSRKRLFELLTDAQEVKWKEMTGEPFRGRFHHEHPRGEARELPKK